MKILLVLSSVYVNQVCLVSADNFTNHFKDTDETSMVNVSMLMNVHTKKMTVKAILTVSIL